KKIAFADKRLNLWYVDVDSGKTVKVDTNPFETPERTFDPGWSPDSQWLTYTKILPNHLHAVFVYSVASGKAWQVTDGMSDARYAQFDANGKYLYFTASTDLGLAADWLDMSSINRPVSRSVYITVLSKTESSPLAPESDEEKVAEEKKSTVPPKAPMAFGDNDKKKHSDEAKAAENTKPGDEADKSAEKKEPVVVKLDVEDIGQRILALPIQARNYVGLSAGKTGTIFLVEAPVVPTAESKLT